MLDKKIFGFANLTWPNLSQAMSTMIQGNFAETKLPSGGCFVFEWKTQIKIFELVAIYQWRIPKA